MDVLTGITNCNEDVCAAGILFANRLLPFQAPRRLAMMPLPEQKQSRDLEPWKSARLQAGKKD